MMKRMLNNEKVVRKKKKLFSITIFYSEDLLLGIGQL